MSSKCYVTVEFIRDLRKDKKAGINPLSSIALEGVIRDEYDLELLTVTSNKILSTSRYRVTANLPVFPEQGDSVYTLLAYRLLHLQQRATKGYGSFDFVMQGITLDEQTYAAGDILLSAKEDQTLAYSRLRIAMEDGVKITKDWLSHLVVTEHQRTKSVSQKIATLLALMEPALHMEDGDKPSGIHPLSNTDVSIRRMLHSHAPKILETISNTWQTFKGRDIWQELGLVKVRLDRLNHLHLSLSADYDIADCSISDLVERFGNSEEATITDKVLRDQLDLYDPETTEGRAFRMGLLIASQLGLENSQKRPGAASLQNLHTDLTASLPITPGLTV